MGSAHSVMMVWVSCVLSRNPARGARYWFSRTGAIGTSESLAPFLIGVVSGVLSAAGLEGAWRGPGEARGPVVEKLLVFAGEVYFPFLTANAQAVSAGKETFSFSALGMPYEQGAFKYQVKCLETLRRMYAELPAQAKSELDPLLERTGCLAGLKG